MAPTDAKSRSRLKRWLVTAVLSLIAGSGLTLLAAWVISSTSPVTQQTKSLQAIDGRLEVRRSLGTGTCVTARLPMRLRQEVAGEGDDVDDAAKR